MSASEYREDAERIERDYVDPESETREEVRQDLEDADFAQAAIDDIAPEGSEGWILTREDVGVPSSPEEAHDGGIITREEVESAVSQAESSKGADFSSSREDALTDAVSQEIGAPTEENLRAAQTQTLSDTVTPEGSSTPASVIRNQSGDAVAVIGTSKGGRQVAEDLGADYVGGMKEYQSNLSIKPSPSGSEGLMYYKGEPVGEVDL